VNRRIRAGWLWLRGLVTRARADRDLQDEIESHLQMHIDDNLRAGMPYEQARRHALVKLGGVMAIREEAREVRAGARLEQVVHDIRQGARLLWRTPGFTILAVMILSLGIGALTTVFTLVNAVVLKPLPVRAPEELVWLRNPSFSFPVLREIRERQQIFSGVFGWSLEDFDVRWTTDTETTSGLVVTGAFYSTLGVQPALGRLISEDDEGRGGLGSPVAVISHGAWIRRFAGEPGVLGHRIVVGKQPFTIVGVAPRGFFGVAIGTAPDVTIPATAFPLVKGRGPEVLSSTSSSWLHIMARRLPGVTFPRAQGAFQAMWPQVLEATARPGQPAERRARYLATQTSLVPGATGFSRVRNRFEEPLWLLLGLVAVLVLVACGAVAHLLFARGSMRQREFAVRLAMGAGRRRLAMQLLIEGLLLSVLASVAGLVTAVWTSGLLVRTLSTAEDPIAIELGLDWRVYGFTAVVAAAMAILFTIVPALKAALLDPGPILKAHARPLDSGARGWKMGQTLVVSQMACSLLLVAGAALFLRSLGTILSIDAGYDRSNLLVVQAEPSRPAPAEGADFYRELRERLTTVPGVLSASLSSVVPIHDGAWTQHMGVDSAEPDDATPQVYFNVVSPGYFETMRTRVLAGRDFRWNEDGSTPSVVVVNETLARIFFGTSNPIGRHLTMGRNASRRVMEIVAIVRNTKYGYLQESDRPIAYMPYLQWRDQDLVSVVRTSVSPAGVVGPLRQAIRTVEPQSPITIETVTDRIRDSLVSQRLIAMVAAYLGGFSLLLGCGALYGLMSHIVARRTNEIGIRVALGARRRQVVWMVMRDTLRLAVLGSAIGLFLVMWSGRVAEKYLFRITSSDPLSLSAATVLLITVAAVAGYLPARRAAHADPVAALRAD
jgi:putative ABC transport system permease protein